MGKHRERQKEWSRTRKHLLSWRGEGGACEGGLQLPVVASPLCYSANLVRSQSVGASCRISHPNAENTSHVILQPWMQASTHQKRMFQTCQSSAAVVQRMRFCFGFVFFSFFLTFLGDLLEFSGRGVGVKSIYLKKKHVWTRLDESKCDTQLDKLNEGPREFCSMEVYMEPRRVHTESTSWSTWAPWTLVFGVPLCACTADTSVDSWVLKTSSMLVLVWLPGGS